MAGRLGAVVASRVVAWVAALVVAPLAGLAATPWARLLALMISLSTAWLVVLPARAADPGPSLVASEPRAFGWRLGDVVERQVWLRLPPGWQLVADSLPAVRADGRTLELQAITREPSDGQELLRLRYQVMRSPTEVRTLEIPPWRLQVKGPSRTETLRVDAWPVVVSPLTPADAANRNGLGELRPDRPPPPRTDPARPWRLALAGVLLLAGLTGLARARWGAWWRRGPQRPLAQAWRRLRRLPAQPDAAALQAALQALHQGLNQSAGQVLLPAGAAAFCQSRPGFAPLQSELQQFFALSDRVFFQNQAAPADAAAALRQLARKLRDAERAT